MTKQEFFINLHQKLAQKYELPIQSVENLRTYVLFLHRTRKECAERLAVKLTQPLRKKHQSYHNRRKYNREVYQKLLNFVASCSPEAWNDITQRTEFDKADTAAAVS